MSEVVTGDILIASKKRFMQYVACDEAPTFRYNCNNVAKVYSVLILSK